MFLKSGDGFGDRHFFQVEGKSFNRRIQNLSLTKKCTLIFFSETRPVVNILKSLYMSFCSVGSGFQMEKRLLECASG